MLYKFQGGAQFTAHAWITHSVFDHDLSGASSLGGVASKKLQQIIMEKSFLKITVELQEGEKSTKKVWRLDINAVKSYTRV